MRLAKRFEFPSGCRAMVTGASHTRLRRTACDQVFSIRIFRSTTSSAANRISLEVIESDEHPDAHYLLEFLEAGFGSDFRDSEEFDPEFILRAEVDRKGRVRRIIDQ